MTPAFKIAMYFWTLEPLKVEPRYTLLCTSIKTPDVLVKGLWNNKLIYFFFEKKEEAAVFQYAFRLYICHLEIHIA